MGESQTLKLAHLTKQNGQEKSSVTARWTKYYFTSKGMHFVKRTKDVLSEKISVTEFGKEKKKIFEKTELYYCPTVKYYYIYWQGYGSTG